MDHNTHSIATAAPQRISSIKEIKLKCLGFSSGGISWGVPQYLTSG